MTIQIVRPYREPAEEPHIKWKHPDGPVLVTVHGYMHWLTYTERLLMWLGLTDIKRLNRKHDQTM